MIRGVHYKTTMKGWGITARKKAGTLLEAPASLKISRDYLFPRGCGSGWLRFSIGPFIVMFFFAVMTFGIGTIVVVVLIIAVVGIGEAAEFRHIHHSAKNLNAGSGKALYSRFNKGHTGFTESRHKDTVVNILAPKQGVAYRKHGRAVHYYTIIIFIRPSQESGETRGI